MIPGRLLTGVFWLFLAACAADMPEPDYILQGLIIQTARANRSDLPTETGQTTPVTPTVTLYTFSGVQLNLASSTLTDSGWSQCFSETYDHIGTTMASISALCSKSRMLMACRVTGSTTLTVAAHALKSEIMVEDANNATSFHSANNVNWYYHATVELAWGFFSTNDANVNNSFCDLTGTYPDYRMCWHTSTTAGLKGGWRCGATIGLNSDATWERVIYHAD
ncbi:MAG: hypothetical protein KDK39_12295 [Leptospiraceae bacterium]|nr:hypothetical protein [Leptospiraceae bacterium]